MSSQLEDTTDPAQPANTEIQPRSIFTISEKWFIVVLASLAGLFSPLTANVYLPAIPTMRDAFHRSTEDINLTVTMYMVFQGIAPMFLGPLADRYGRRPLFCFCLALLVVSCIALALVPTSQYWLLLFLRCFQSTGSASTIAFGAGVVGDISETAERGGFYGVYNILPTIGPAIGPVIGGALAGHLGWRSIFWFVSIAAASCLIIMILFLPETLRTIVGNGSIRPGRVHRPLIPLIGRKRMSNQDRLPTNPRKLVNPLRILMNLDILLLLFTNALAVAVFYSITATVSSLFVDTYPFLNETTIGLCYLAAGGGMAPGGFVAGFILDKEYQRFKKKNEEGDTFPIEKTRLRLMPFYFALEAVACIGYGWCIERKVNLAGPLVLLFLIGFFTMGIAGTSQTLLVDLMPDKGSSVTACNNLLRCTTSAAAVAVVDLILRAVGPGWTWVIFGGILLALIPLLYLLIHIGPRCRSRRRESMR